MSKLSCLDRITLKITVTRTVTRIKMGIISDREITKVQIISRIIEITRTKTKIVLKVFRVTETTKIIIRTITKITEVPVEVFRIISKVIRIITVIRVIFKTKISKDLMEI